MWERTTPPIGAGALTPNPTPMQSTSLYPPTAQRGGLALCKPRERRSTPGPALGSGLRSAPQGKSPPGGASDRAARDDGGGGARRAPPPVSSDRAEAGSDAQSPSLRPEPAALAP